MDSTKLRTLQTDRLEIIVATKDFLGRILKQDQQEAGRQLKVIVPSDWPQEDLSQPDSQLHLSSHFWAIHKNPVEEMWHIRLAVLKCSRDLAGVIIMKGPPRETGTVEIGWYVQQAFRKQGIAVEAASAVINWALTQPRVRRVIALVTENNLASTKVAQRLNMEMTIDTRNGHHIWEIFKRP